MNDKKIDCLLLTGMHRSGLSALVEGLALMGIDFGSDDKKEILGNAESSATVRDVVMIHDLLLRDLGCKWDMIGALPDNWLETPAAESARDRIVQLIENRFHKDKVWAVADPRLCRLLPLWISVLQEKEIRPGVILTLRHPWEVAQALGKDNEMDVRRSHLLWLATNKEVFDTCQEKSYLVHTYDQMLADPAAILGSIEEQFGLELPYSVQERIHRLMDAVRPEFKHYHRSNFQQKESDQEFYYSFAWLYDQINNHRSALRLLAQENGEKADADLVSREEFPTRFYPDTLPGLKKDMGVQKQSNQQGSKIFHSFLSLIGQYERDQRNLELQKLQRILSATRVPETLFARLVASASREERDSETADVLLSKNEWQLVRFPIHHTKNLKTDGLSLYPLNTRGIVSISSLSIVNIASEEVYWKAANLDSFETFTLNNALRLPGDDALVIMTTTNDAAIAFPELPEVPDVPLELHVWIKVDTSQEVVTSAWQTLNKKKSQLKNKLNQALENNKVLSVDLEDKTNLLSRKEQELAATEQENDSKIISLKIQADKSSQESSLRLSQIKELNKQLEAIYGDLVGRDARIAELEQEMEKNRSQQESLNQQIVEQDAALKNVKEEKKDLKKQLSNASSELSRRQNRISELSKALERDQHDLHAKEETIEQWQKKVDESSQLKQQIFTEKLAEKNRSNESLRARVAQYEKTLKEMEKQLAQEKARSNEVAAQSDGALNDAKEIIDTRFNEIIVITKMLKEKEDLLVENSEALKAKKDDVNRLEKLLSQKSKNSSEQDRRIIQLNDELNKKDRQILNNQEELDAISSQLVKKSSTIASQESENESLKQKIESLKDQIMQLSGKLEEKKIIIGSVMVEKRRLNKHLVQKEKAIQAKDIELELQKKKVDKFRRSASWKLMSPIRALARPFKKRPYKAEPAEIQIEQIRESEYFDQNWYLEQYPDVEENKLDPAEHYFYFGVSEGRDPGPDFNTAWYMQTYPDTAEIGINPLIHYIKYGKEEGRSTKEGTPIQKQIESVKMCDLFDAGWYLEQYPNVKAEGVDPAEHYCIFGVAEGKNPGPDFDTKWYVKNYPDVAKSGINPLVHYLMFGEKEGRACKSA